MKRTMKVEIEFTKHYPMYETVTVEVKDQAELDAVSDRWFQQLFNGEYEDVRVLVLR